MGTSGGCSAGAYSAIEAERVTNLKRDPHEGKARLRWPIIVTLSIAGLALASWALREQLFYGATTVFFEEVRPSEEPPTYHLRLRNSLIAPASQESRKASEAMRGPSRRKPPQVDAASRRTKP